MRSLRIVGLASALTLTLGEGEAAACSCVQSSIGAGRLYLGAGESLPPDARGFPWTGGEPLTPERVTVVRVDGARVDGARKVPVKHAVTAAGPLQLIVPAAKFRPGQVYEVTLREGPLGAGQREATPPDRAVPPAETTTRVTIAARPTRLAGARLVAGAAEEKPLSVRAPVSCSTGVQASTLSLRVELPPEVEPLREYLVFETRVDGRPWTPSRSLCSSPEPGRTWTEATGTDLVFAVCEQGAAPLPGAIDQVSPGLHRIEVEVATPDRAQVLTTPAIEHVFGCSPPTQAPETEAPEEAPPVAATPEETAPPQLEAPQEPPPVAARGCAIGGPAGFAWVLGAGWLVRRRRRSGCR